MSTQNNKTALQWKDQNKCSKTGIETVAKIFDKVCNLTSKKSLISFFINAKHGKKNITTFNHFRHFFFFFFFFTKKSWDSRTFLFRKTGLSREKIQLVRQSRNSRKSRTEFKPGSSSI